MSIYVDCYKRLMLKKCVVLMVDIVKRLNKNSHKLLTNISNWYIIAKHHLTFTNASIMFKLQYEMFEH